jgi:RecA/RadA recombinase
VLEPLESPVRHPLSPLSADVASTGFPALDAILGTGGLPRAASVAVRGGASSGKTTLALRTVAEIQAAGSIVAWLDLTDAFDPLEAAARGVDLQWLVVLRSPDPVEGLRLAGALLSGRAIDLLVVDLPRRLPAAREALLRRLAAHARRIGARLLVLEPVGLTTALIGALAEASGIRLELEREGWIRVGRDVVGQRTAVTVAKNRYGPPGRRAQLEIRYAEEGDRGPGVMRRLDTPPARVAPAPQLRLLEPEDTDRPTDDATAAPVLDSPAAPIRARPSRVPERSRGRRRAAVGSGDRPRLRPRGAPAGRASGSTAGIRP